MRFYKSVRFNTLIDLENQLKKIEGNEKSFTDNSIRALKQKIKMYKKLVYSSKYYE